MRQKGRDYEFGVFNEVSMSAALRDFKLMMENLMKETEEGKMFNIRIKVTVVPIPKRYLTRDT
jgi:hypothetical protein